MISATAVNDADNLLDLQSVTKAYRLETKQFLAVKDINLHIKPGEFVCLLGPSGCGKSTLLRIIAGLNVATSGVVSYHGQPLKGVNPYTTIVFQTFALYPWLTVQENVEIALKARGVAPAERRERALKLIDIVGLDGFESAYPRELSGGMRQKVGFRPRDGRRTRIVVFGRTIFCAGRAFSRGFAWRADGTMAKEEDPYKGYLDGYAQH